MIVVRVSPVVWVALLGYFDLIVLPLWIDKDITLAHGCAA